MGERTTLTISTTPEIRRRLERLATALDRSKSYVMNEAIERHLAAEEEFVTAVQEGITDADAGRLYTTEEVQAAIRKSVAGRSAS